MARVLLDQPVSRVREGLRLLRPESRVPMVLWEKWVSLPRAQQVLQAPQVLRVEEDPLEKRGRPASRDLPDFNPREARASQEPCRQREELPEIRVPQGPLKQPGLPEARGSPVLRDLRDILHQVPPEPPD